mmetsp:Transcript_30958/g.71525  ORF Transcript_30958/g.71525 Transcript_30958/m.71525 type:complete len:227 (+) Transcript_30958:86-766(+)
MSLCGRLLTRQLECGNSGTAPSVPRAGVGRDSALWWRVLFSPCGRGASSEAWRKPSWRCGCRSWWKAACAWLGGTTQPMTNMFMGLSWTSWSLAAGHSMWPCSRSSRARHPNTRTRLKLPCRSRRRRWPGMSTSASAMRTQMASPARPFVQTFCASMRRRSGGVLLSAGRHRQSPWPCFSGDSGGPSKEGLQRRQSSPTMTSTTNRFARTGGAAVACHVASTSSLA